MVYIFLTSLLCGLICSRVTTILARGQLDDNRVIAIFLNLFGMIATFLIIITSFFIFSWWVPITAFVVGSFLVGLLIMSPRIVFFAKVSPILNIFAVIGSAILVYEAWIA